jgi:hypothetical protein
LYTTHERILVSTRCEKYLKKLARKTLTRMRMQIKIKAPCLPAVCFKIARSVVEQVLDIAEGKRKFRWRNSLCACAEQHVQQRDDKGEIQGTKKHSRDHRKNIGNEVVAVRPGKGK